MTPAELDELVEALSPSVLGALRDVLESGSSCAVPIDEHRMLLLQTLPPDAITAITKALGMTCQRRGPGAAKSDH